MQLASGLVALLVALIVVVFLPELPLSILVGGMSLWHMIPGLSQFEWLQGNTLLATVLLAYGSLLLATLARRRDLLLPRVALEDLLLFAFTVWVALGILWSDSPSYGTTKFMTFAAYTSSGYLLVRIIYPSRTLVLQRAAVLLSMLGLMQAIVALKLVRLRSDSLLFLEIPRRTLKDIGLNPIYETKALVIAILATLWLVNSRSSSRRWGWHLMLPVLAVLLLALVAYGQRGAFVSLTCSSVLLLSVTAYIAFRTRLPALHWRRPVVRRRVLFIGLALAASLLVAVLLLSPVFMPSRLANDQSFLLRLGWYRIGFLEFMSSPFIGAGTGALGDLGKDGFQFYPHNRLVEVLAENGLIGFSIMFLLSVGVAVRAYRVIVGVNGQRAFEILLPASILVHEHLLSMFSTDLGNWSIGVWMGLIVAISQKPRCQSLKLTTSPTT
jgi:O-antigen ligase